MIEENINKPLKKLKIIAGVLDWGLGHATRMIPVINALQFLGHEVIIAGSGNSFSLLKEEFPENFFLELPSYNIRLSTNRAGFMFKILSQVPFILKTTREENRILREYVETNNADLIISDNRFGFYHHVIPSIYVTHQLDIETGFSFLNKLATRVHARLFSRFTRIWVPDFRKSPGLAGKLSHPKAMPAIPVSYLGPLSRLRKTNSEKKDNLLCILSGPEPQRSMFEKKILEQAGSLKHPVILIRGLPGSRSNIMIDIPNVSVYNHMGSVQLAEYIESASKVICRSGYSTVMDLHALAQYNAVLVPTPGQSEQEYLAKHLEASGLFMSIEQDDLDIKKLLKRIPGDSKSFPVQEINLHRILDEEINSLLKLRPSLQ